MKNPSISKVCTYDPAHPPQGLHPTIPLVRPRHEDDRAVERFSKVMKDKLARKREEGRGGWDDKESCSNEFLSALLREHVEKGDPVDVANIAMMIHQRGECIAALSSAPSRIKESGDA